MYHICNHVVKPLTADDKCSWVEMVAQGTQKPMWFVSHAWSTRLQQTIEMLNWHGEVHSDRICKDSPYWICTFAMNQHDLAELGGGLIDTPFWQAIKCWDCWGVVQVMDEHCSPVSYTHLTLPTIYSV
eukprot:TRINITY_DN27583_c0_g1_i1.p1 TRINITY_DN27583_c0_g1~~TRINITY_DN27583_c0_g1_i1.p1  ORF type:complete len:128 (+),score=18.15 TRINITY_DN27583_c0_g1_i1:198-581(+)